MTWRELQSEVATWARHNFPGNLAWHPLLGIMEEVGEYYAAQVSSESLAPNRDRMRVGVQDALGDQTIYAVSLCQEVGAEFSDISADPRNVACYLSDRELMGALAMGARAVLKHSQGIRGYTDGRRCEDVTVAVGLWYRWAQAQARVWSLGDYYASVREVWEGVRKRDWRKNPVDANEKVDELVTWQLSQDFIMVKVNSDD